MVVFSVMGGLGSDDCGGNGKQSEARASFFAILINP
jgi:hypothetical protein